MGPALQRRLPPAPLSKPRPAVPPRLPPPRLLCSLPRIQLPADAVQQLAACTLLQELDCELNYTVRWAAALAKNGD